MMRWSFWLFVLAEFCRCETKGTWRGVCSGIPSKVQGQSSWGGSRRAWWSCRLFSPGVKLASLAFWKCYRMCHQDKRIRMYDIKGEGGIPIFSHRFCANLVSGPGGQWGVETPQTTHGLAIACVDATMQLTKNSYRQLFPGKIFSLTFPRFLVKSLTFSWQLSNFLTFPGFPDKWSPWN